MNDRFAFTIDGVEVQGRPGQTIMQAADEAGIYIPRLCSHKELAPHGSCRVCTVLVNGRPQTACTQPAGPGIIVENSSEALLAIRCNLIEMLFIEGNHFCMFCEKSGNCELQALGYRYRLTVPRFPYLWPGRELDAAAPLIMVESNRCVQCRRCISAVKAKDGRKVFAMTGRGPRTTIEADRKLAAKLSEEEARKAMDVCPVGAILKKETGFAVPIGKRKFDHVPIGSDVEKGAGR